MRQLPNSMGMPPPPPTLFDAAEWLGVHCRRERDARMEAPPPTADPPEQELAESLDASATLLVGQIRCLRLRVEHLEILVRGRGTGFRRSKKRRQRRNDEASGCNPGESP